jgi:ArsR family transcriptional regulator
MNKQVVDVLKALADETRIEIIRFLLKKKEIACKDLMTNFSLSQPTLSHHFNKLIDANILHDRKEGVNHIYRINYDFLHHLGINIYKLVNFNKGGITK